MGGHIPYVAETIKTKNKAALMKFLDRLFRRNVAPRMQRKISAAQSVLFFTPGQKAFPDWDHKQLAFEGYQKNVIAFACIDKVAIAVAACPIQLIGDGKEIEKHPLIDLLARPNPQQSGRAFIHAVISRKLISGNSYIEAAVPSGETTFTRTPPTWLYSLRSDFMKIREGANRIPSSYSFSDGLKDKEFPVTILGQSQILHLKAFNPLNDWYGMSPLSAAAMPIDMHNNATSWNTALLENGARPSGAILMDKEVGDGELTDAQFNNLRAEIDEKFSGAANAGRPIILEGGMTWQEMSLSPQDMDYINSKHTSARDISLALGCPPQLLGIPGDSTFNNMSEAKVAFWTQTIIPEAERLITELNHWLVPHFGAGLKLKLNKNELDALSHIRERKFKLAQESDFITTNEKRILTGFETIPGGDEILIPANMLPIGTGFSEDE